MGQIWDKNPIKIIKLMQNIINTKFTVEVWDALFTAVLNGAGNEVRTRDTKLGKLNIAFSKLLILLIN